MMKSKQRIAEAVELIGIYGSGGCVQHKTWVIDQVLRKLLSNKAYTDLFLVAHRDGPWDSGLPSNIAP